MQDPSGAIRPLRTLRGSAPISAELFTSTTDPLVLAFQTSMMFHRESDGTLTLAVLAQRWGASRRGAAAARRALIDLGYWAEVRVRQPGGLFRTETRSWEVRLTEDDLADLAAEYAPSSRIECAGRVYHVSDSGALHNRGTTSGNPVPPGVSVTGVPPVVTRSHQGVSVTGVPPVVTRSHQGKQPIPAGRTELPPAVTQHASSVRSTDDEQPCMHDEFWSKIAKLGVVQAGGRRSVAAHLDTAFAAGWTVDALAGWVAEQVSTARGKIRSRPGFIVAQLRCIPAPVTPHQDTSPDLPPCCPACADASPGARTNPNARYVVDPDTGRYVVDPDTGRRVKCPSCHPDLVPAAVRVSA